MLLHYSDITIGPQINKYKAKLNPVNLYVPLQE